MKQTAVEWLENIIAKMEAYGGDLPHLMVHIQQAKEMEKEQIIDAYEEGTYHNTFGNENYETSEEYYNETFNK